MIFAGNNGCYCLKTKKTYCGSFQNDIPHKGKIGMTGFTVLINRKFLERDDYSIYLKIGKMMCDTGKEFSCN